MNEAQTPYQLLGEQGIRDLCDAFYDIMDTLPEAAGVRAMHAADLSPVKGKLAEYLIGWMGGPPLYAHEAYHIGPEERDQWLLCMDRALERIGASEEVTAMLKLPMFRIADAVRNREGPSATTTNSDIIAAG